MRAQVEAERLSCTRAAAIRAARSRHCPVDIERRAAESGCLERILFTCGESPGFFIRSVRSPGRGSILDQMLLVHPGREKPAAHQA